MTLHEYPSSDEVEPTPEEREAQREQNEKNEAQALRAELRALGDEDRELRQEIGALELRFALEDAGFDPASPEGKALTKLYPEDRARTAEDVATFAADEFGFTPVTPQDEAAAAEAEHRELVATLREEGESRLSMLASGSIPSREPSLHDQRRAAEARGDWAESDRINVAILTQGRR